MCGNEIRGGQGCDISNELVETINLNNGEQNVTLGREETKMWQWKEKTPSKINCIRV